MKRFSPRRYFMPDAIDIDLIHQRISDLMISCALSVTIIVTAFYIATANWQMLPGGIAGVVLCGSSLALSRRYNNAGKLLFVIAANGLIVLSHQQFNGLIPTYLYFFSTATGPLVLFPPREIKSIVFCALLSLVLGLITVRFPNLFHIAAPKLSEESSRFIVPVIWITSFAIAIAPPALLFLLSRKLHERVVSEQARRFHSTRLHSLGEIAAGVAHEINNPLAVVAGKVEALLEELGEASPPDLAKMRRDLQMIDQNCGYIARIVKTLQTYSRQGIKDKAQAVNVRALIDDTCLLMKQSLQKSRTRLTIDCAADLQLLGVSSEMMQALSNLISNALDAMDSIPELQRHLMIQGSKLEKRVFIKVLDQGPGFDPLHAERIFDPFFTTKDPGKGTGLGLSIVHSIVSRHHGLVHASRHGKQTVFTMELPHA